MSTRLAKNKQIFLVRWISLSFIGWLIGIFCVFWAGDLQSSHWVEIYNYSPFLERLSSMAVWLPLGTLIGAMQSIQLRHLKTNTLSWVLASAFGWWIPVTVVSLYFESGLYWTVPLFPILSILITGLSIGASQIYALGRSFSKPKILLISNVLGIVVLACFIVWIFPSETSILDWITFVFIGTLTTSLPSGISLLRFERREEGSNISVSEEFNNIQDAG
ncbi:MAG TPA: hypothetical protein VK206_06830 [Anaerolineales bacterium]|nr:hypothetical protein [Anaerolineales bacterium]